MEYEEYKPKSYPTQLLNKDWTKRKCYVRTGYTPFISQMHDMEVKPDDVWVVTLPKCGTTWMQELVWLVMHDFDFEGAKSEHLELRAPYLEFDFWVYSNLERAFKPVESLQSPRQIKSHMPLPLLPKQLWTKNHKVIYVFRNPKDAAISRYYHERSLGLQINRSLAEYMDTYIDKTGFAWQPIEHAIEFYELRNEPWVYYTSFEKMKTNLRQVIAEVCKFLEKPITEEQMQKMLHHLSFEEMKKNPTTNHHWESEQSCRHRNIPYTPHDFVRSGKVNNYKEELSSDTVTKLDNWIEQQLAPYNISLEEMLLEQPK